jgi:chromosomal replication initiator protein
VIGRVSVDRIKAVVAAEFDVPIREMTSNRRPRRVALPRQAAMALAYSLTPASSALVGRLFGDRDHTTVIYARQKIDRLRVDDRKFADRMRRIEERLAPPVPAREVQLEFLIGPLFDCIPDPSPPHRPTSRQLEAA